MIDLHTHTRESDGTYSPAHLVEAAVETGLEALGITDHDTLAGYDQAEPAARSAGLDLVCGIELSTKFEGRTVHLLGYFPRHPPSQEFRQWLEVMRISRRDRNLRLVERLRSLGIDISIEEVETKGRSLAGRPHFARLLVEKGYVPTIQAAFDQYLAESAKGYVSREEPGFAEGVERIVATGGIASLAHPIRVARVGDAGFPGLLGRMRDFGLGAVEAYHSDQSPNDTVYYLDLAKQFALAITGGSDFHGENKPRIRLGRGYDGTLAVPRILLDLLRGL